MKAAVQIFLCSVIGGLAMMNMDMCVNNGSTTLSSCQSNPNIRVEKILGKDDIKSYRLSLYHRNTNTWWTAKNDKWIECKHLCDVCKSLPGIDNVNEVCSGNQCEREVDMFLNSFCASATHTTHISTVTDTQTITSTSSFTETVTSTSHLTETVTSTTCLPVFITSTSHLTETVTSVMPTTAERFTTKITTEAQKRTTTFTTTERVTITPPVSTTIIVSTVIVTVSPTSTPRLNTDDKFRSDPAQNAPTVALGSLIGVFVVALAAVIIGWVWTCWTIKRRGGDSSSKNMVIHTNTNENERYFENPTYDNTSTMQTHTSCPLDTENQNSSTAVYNTIHSQAPDENGEYGPAYDVLNRGQSIDHRRGRAVINLPGSEDYSQLDLCDNDVENNYQLLDKEDPGLKVKK